MSNSLREKNLQDEIVALPSDTQIWYWDQNRGGHAWLCLANRIQDIIAENARLRTALDNLSNSLVDPHNAEEPK